MGQDCDGVTGCIEHATAADVLLVVEHGSELKEDMWTAGSTRVRERGREDAIADPLRNGAASWPVGTDQERHVDRARGAESGKLQHSDWCACPFHRLAP